MEGSVNAPDVHSFTDAIETADTTRNMLWFLECINFGTEEDLCWLLLGIPADSRQRFDPVPYLAMTALRNRLMARADKYLKAKELELQAKIVAQKRKIEALKRLTAQEDEKND